jgi:hypothetical protein
MWIIDWLPSGVFNALLVLGTVLTISSFVLTHIPIIKQYRVPFQVFSILLLVLGAWATGATSRDQVYALKVAKLEKQLAESQRDSAIANSRVETVYIDKIQRVKDVQVVIQEKIRDIAVTVDSQCYISVDTIDVLNRAAKNPNRK